MVTAVISDQFFVHTIVGQQVTLSLAWEEFIGSCATDLQSWDEIIHSANLGEFISACRRADSLKIPQHCKFFARDSNGNYHQFQSNIVPIVINGHDGVSINSVPCDHRCLFVQDRYALIKLIVNSLHAMVAYIDKERRYVYVNRAYEEFYQLPRQEIEGQLAEPFLNKACQKSKIYLDEVFSGESVSFEGEFCLPDSDESYHVRITLVPHLDDGCEVLGCFVLGNPIEPIGVADARFEDLERFLSYWANNPDGFAHFVGWAIGRLIPHKFHDLFLAIGASYYSLKSICSRVEFLYRITGKKEDIVVKDDKEIYPIATLCKKDGVLCIRSSWGQWMMLLKDKLDGLPYYSIRYYVEAGERATGYLKAHWRSEWGRPAFATVLAQIENGISPEFEEDYTFWNFRIAEDVLHGVVVYPHSDGFFDPWETKRLGDLIVQVSNLKNFDRQLT